MKRTLSASDSVAGSDSPKSGEDGSKSDADAAATMNEEEPASLLAASDEEGNAEDGYRLISKLRTFEADYRRRIVHVRNRELRLQELDEKARAQQDAALDRVLLNVGGQRFEINKTYLLSVDDTYFTTLLGNAAWKPSLDGSYFIDRSPLGFDLVMSYLRDGRLWLDAAPVDAIRAARAHFDYLMIPWPKNCYSMWYPDLRVTSKAINVHGPVMEWSSEDPLDLVYVSSQALSDVQIQILDIDTSTPSSAYLHIGAIYIDSLSAATATVSDLMASAFVFDAITGCVWRPQQSRSSHRSLGVSKAGSLSTASMEDLTVSISVKGQHLNRPEIWFTCEETDCFVDVPADVVQPKDSQRLALCVFSNCRFAKLEISKPSSA